MTGSMGLTVPAVAAPAPPGAVRAPESAGASGVDTAARALQLARTALTPTEEVFARAFVRRRNATAAYIEAFPDAPQRMQRYVIRQHAWKMANNPDVLARCREYESAAARETVIDVAAILDHDRRIVEGFEHADQITQYIRGACRYCHGVDHAYQWVDYPEYLAALSKAEEDNTARVERKQKPKPMPDDSGGYGYNLQLDPVITCPRCEGLGLERAIIADTTKLEGPARAIVKGIKVTSTGIEVIMHDVDKAKERLLRASGAFGDDAASVARGAAAGAAAGSAAGARAAAALAEKAKSMTPDDVRRAYLASL